MSVPIPGNATLTLRGLKVQKSILGRETIDLLMSFGVGFSASLVANFLYDKIRGRADGIAINRIMVDVDRGEITRVFIERIDSRPKK